MKVITCVMIGLFLAALPAIADDIQPPWWRGQISTTSQMWEFLSPGQPTPPDGPAPGGQPPLAGTMTYVEGGTWQPTYGGRGGVWYVPEPGAGYMDVWVTNHNPPNLVKMVQVQITWTAEGTTAGPWIYGIDPPPSLPPTVLAEVPLEGAWKETTFYFEIRPNPAQEQFFIGGGIMVDELVVDTWCIPEPATLSLLALGGLAAIRRRRK